MSYEIILSPAAEEQFVNFPPLVQQFLEDKLNRLAENPRHVFFIPFRFSQDETSIQILAIATDTPYH